MRYGILLEFTEGSSEPDGINFCDALDSFAFGLRGCIADFEPV